MKTSIRTFARALKAAAPPDNDTLAAFMEPYYPAAKTATRTLTSYTVTAIELGTSVHTLRELFGAVDVTLKRVATPGMVSNAFVEIRAAARDKHGDASPVYAAAKTKLVDDKKYHASVREKTAAAVAAKTAAPKVITWAALRRVVDITRNSDAPVDMLVFLMLCSGARRGEVVERSSFEAMPGGRVRQTGIEKSRTLEVVEKEVLYTTPADFVARFKRFRTAMASRGVATINSMVQRRMVELSAVFGAPVVTHDLRRMYAAVSYAVHRGAETFISWISTRLGHEGLNSAQYYMTIDVPMDAGDAAEARGMVDDAAAEPDTKDGGGDADDGPIIPRNIKKRDGKASERLDATVASLDAAGIRYTQRTLKEYGYSSTTITEWFARRNAAQ
jgi:hypothetical protein